VTEPAGAPELAPRQQLDLRIASDDGVHSLRTHVEYFDRASGRLRVGWPTDRLRLFPLMPGQLVMVEVARPGDALYNIEMLIESATTEEPPSLILRPDGPWQRVQRRRALRHPVDMRPTSALQLRGTSREPVAFSAIISDLSAGGLRLATVTELQVSDEPLVAPEQITEVPRQVQAPELVASASDALVALPRSTKPVAVQPELLPAPAQRG